MVRGGGRDRDVRIARVVVARGDSQNGLAWIRLVQDAIEGFLSVRTPLNSVSFLFSYLSLIQTRNARKCGREGKV